MKHFLIVTTLALFLFASTPMQSHAVGFDPATFVKEWGLDTLGWFLGGLMTGELTRTTADWVNSGFNAVSRSVAIDPDTGEPVVSHVLGTGDATFVVNPSAFFRNITAESAQTFLVQLNEASSDPSQALNTIFPGFTADLLKEIALDTQRKTGTFFENFESDLQVAELDAYLNDFSAGGWDMFLRTTQICANNYGCSRIAVLSELDSRVAGAVGEKQTELDQGGGFLTIKRCVERSDTEPGGCARYEDVTPGKLVGEQITKATTIEFDRLTEMDELTEVLVTLLERALNTLIAQGLSSLSNNLFSRDLPSQYDSLAKKVDDEIERVKKEAKGAEGVGEDHGTDFDPETATSCATVSGGGNMCTPSTDVDMRATMNGASHELNVVYSGNETFESDIEYDFGEFSNNVTVTTSSESSNGTGVLTDGDVVNIVVEIIDPDLIEDFNDFEGVIKIGDLEITIRGVDRRAYI